MTAGPMRPSIWVDGRVGPAEDAAVPALDRGLTVGDGVFETCKVVDGRPFALTRHLRRLRRSAQILGLPGPPADGALREAVEDTLAAAGLAPPARGLARLRIMLTSGAGALGSRAPHGGPGRLVVAVGPQEPWPAEGTAVTVPWTRNERSAVAGAKTTSYAENVVALRHAHRRGAHEAILANTAGLLCEGTGSNVVVAVGGRLVTPPLHSGCLAGVTRELLLQWGREEGLALEEADVPMADLAASPEVLLVSTTRDVQPLAFLDGHALPGRSLGRAAAELFARRAALDIDP
jgi:branched-chain amino acid aminotransferase